MQCQLIPSRSAKVKNARRFPVWSARYMWTSFKTSWGIPLIWPSSKPCVSSSSLFTPLMTSVVCTHQVDAILENTHWTMVCELIERFHSRDYRPYWLTETKESICIKIEFNSQAPVVQRLDNFLQWISHYPTVLICAKIPIFPRAEANMHTLTRA